MVEFDRPKTNDKNVMIRMYFCMTFLLDNYAQPFFFFLIEVYLYCP